ncbi:MAG: molybdopterin-dependent oxidoreductase [Longimicrobiales bacterium]
MERKDFLKATSVGAGLTILQGCGSPEEEFIVQRVRQTPELPGQSGWRLGVCRQCGAGCGIVVRVVDGDAKKIEGNPAHPVNRGGVCALGHSVLQELYNPDRLLQAQRRTGEQFEALAWEDAIAQVVSAIGAVPANRIAIVASDRSSLTGGLWRRLAAAMGAPAPAFVEAPELEVERRAAQLAFGSTELPFFDIARADCVLSIGAPILDPGRSLVHYTRAFADMRRARPTRRGRFIQAEARMSLTAASADVWLPIRPGTEGVFARAVAGHILASGAVAPDAARRYRVLFPGSPPTTADAASQCDVPEERIVAVANELAGAENPVVVGGGSAAAHTNGLANVAAAFGLNVLLGNLGRAGGVFAPASVGLNRTVEPNNPSDTPIAELAARLRGESGEPVELLIVADADPVHALPAGWGIREAVANIPTVIVFGSFRDDTALEADLILPLATELERFEAYESPTSVGVAAFGVAEPIVEPVGDGRHPADILLAVARALPDPVASRFPWTDYEALVRARVGEDLARLPGSDGATATAYLSAAMDRGGIFGDAAPTAAPSGPTGAAPEPTGALFDGDAGFGFALLPFASVKSGEGRGANRPWLQEHPDPLSTVMWGSWVEIAPSDAAELGIVDGDRVRLESSVGAVETHAVIDPAVRPGVLSMPLGGGYVDNGRYAAGRGANVMALVGATRVDGTTASAWAATRVRLTRLGEGSMVRFGRRYDGGEPELIPVGWAPQEPQQLVQIREARV